MRLQRRRCQLCGGQEHVDNWWNYIIGNTTLWFGTFFSHLLPTKIILLNPIPNHTHSHLPEVNGTQNKPSTLISFLPNLQKIIEFKKKKIIKSCAKDQKLWAPHDFQMGLLQILSSWSEVVSIFNVFFYIQLQCLCKTGPYIMAPSFCVAVQALLFASSVKKRLSWNFFLNKPLREGPLFFLSFFGNPTQEKRL